MQQNKTDILEFNMEPTEPKVAQYKPKTKTRLNADSYKIRKRLNFDKFDDILVLQKIKKVSFFTDFVCCMNLNIIYVKNM